VRVDGDAEARCFLFVSVGLHIHKLLNVVPELTVANFTRFLRETYALPCGAAVTGEVPKVGERCRAGVRGGDGVLRGPVVTELRGETPVAVNPFDARVAGRARVDPGRRTRCSCRRARCMHAHPGGAVREDGGHREVGVRRPHGRHGAPVPRVQRGRPDHPAIKDPDSVHPSGWLEVDDPSGKKIDRIRKDSGT
jgi:hypothetical protein